MPFITEELWQNVNVRAENESIMLAEIPKFEQQANGNVLQPFANTLKLVEQIRRIRAEKNIAQKNPLTLQVIAKEQQENFPFNTELFTIVTKLCNIEAIEWCDEKAAGSASFIEYNIEFAIPLADNINVEEELIKLNEELKYAEGFLNSVLKKLSNEKFVAGAPAQVVENEKKKQTDTEEKIAMLKAQIANLS